MNSCGQLPGRINNRSAYLPRRISKYVRTLLSSCHALGRGGLRSVVGFRIYFRQVRPFRSKGKEINHLVIFGRYLTYNRIPFVVASRLGVFCCHKLRR